MEVMLDQHIMINEKILKKMVSSAKIKKDDTVLEIGAGTGNLTKELVKTKGKIIAVEISKKFEKDLKNIKAEIVFGNILKMIDKIRFDKVISNLPYSICEALIQKLIFCDFKLAVLTVPRSFAYRLLGKSRLGLLAQEFFDAEILFEVEKNAFRPEPKTNSVVILLKKRKRKSLFSRVVLQQKMKVKNAVMRCLFEEKKMTKNQARKHLKTLKLNNKLLEKRVKDTDLEDFKTLKKTL